MFRNSLSAFVLASCLAPSAFAVPISIVPEPGVSGTSGAPFGFSAVPVTQQFTSSTLFGALGGPAQLLSLDFGSTTISPVGTTIIATGKSILAGFTTVPLGSLTANQATNLSNPLTTVASDYAIVSQAGTFNWHIDFSTPIVYDPSQGNLVLQFVGAANTGLLVNASGSTTNSVAVFNSGLPGPFNQSRQFQFNFNTLAAGAPELNPSSSRLPLYLLGLTLLALAGKRREA